jgi:hypothetical protein
MARACLNIRRESLCKVYTVMLGTDMGDKLNVGRIRNAEKVLYIFSSFGKSYMARIGRHLMHKTRESDRLSSVRIAEIFPINILIRKIIVIRWNFTIFCILAIFLALSEPPFCLAPP